MSFARAQGWLRHHRGTAMLPLIIFAACQQAGGDKENARSAEIGLSAVGVVLPTSEAQRLLTYCDGSRAQADSLWTPSDSELRGLEVRLHEHLRNGAAPSTVDPLQGFSRQYLGLHRGGEKLVFVRGVAQEYLMRTVAFDTQSVPESVKVASVIRRFGENTVDVCDGGRGFFRAEYNVRTQRISRFAFQDYESR